MPIGFRRVLVELLNPPDNDMEVIDIGDAGGLNLTTDSIHIQVHAYVTLCRQL